MISFFCYFFLYSASATFSCFVWMNNRCLRVIMPMVCHQISEGTAVIMNVTLLDCKWMTPHSHSFHRVAVPFSVSFGVSVKFWDLCDRWKDLTEPVHCGPAGTENNTTRCSYMVRWAAQSGWRFRCETMRANYTSLWSCFTMFSNTAQDAARRYSASIVLDINIIFLKY